MRKEEVIEKLREYKAENSEVYGIEALGLFGSYARGEQLPGSDIDVCIRLKQPTFFNMADIQEDLENIFQCKVDLVSLGAILRPVFKKNLERDAVYV